MEDEQRFLVDVGMRNIHFPIRARSRENPDGQPTIAEITIAARIWQKFEASWIDRFIQIVHRHRDAIGPETLRRNIMDYYHELRAASVRVEFRYPFFQKKKTPASGEDALTHYRARYSAQVTSLERGPRVVQRIEVPVITTYPGTEAGIEGGLFGQLTAVDCEVETRNADLFPEDIIDIVDHHALVPVYSFLTPEDKAAIIRKVHSERKTSVVMTDEIKQELREHPAVRWYAVRCSNYGMLHTYSTFVATEKSTWAPATSMEETTV